MENCDIFKVVENYKELLRRGGFSELELRVVIIDILSDLLSSLESEKIVMVLDKMNTCDFEDIEDV